MSRILLLHGWFALMAMTLAACGGGEGGGGGGGGDGGVGTATPAQPYSDFFSAIPTAPVYPADNPFTLEKQRLGELLFWDPLLSGDMDVSCASCHHPDHEWADGRKLSIGVGGSGLGPRRDGASHTEFHSPSILNVAFSGLTETEAPDDFLSGPYFWDLRAPTLESQALDPLMSAIEMRGSNFSEEEILDEIVARLALNSEYVLLFAEAFGGEDPITPDNIARALATFQRSIVTGRTRFDDFLDGDETALTTGEIAGLNAFINAGCTDCHKGPMLSDFEIHDDKPILRERPAVRTPSLRNVAQTSPYMHIGSRASLRNAVSLYKGRDDLDVHLREDDFNAVVTFLRSLTDEDIYRSVPPAVPSGFPVGGFIVN